MYPFKLHYQTLRHRPELGINGNCHTTVIACLLNKEIEDVPHFGEGLNFADTEGAGVIFCDRVAEYLASQGLAEFTIAYGADVALSTILRSVSGGNPKVPMILGCMSNNGNNHSVILYDGEIAHDPSTEENAGVSGAMDSGQWTITILVPLSYNTENVCGESPYTEDEEFQIEQCEYMQLMKGFSLNDSAGYVRPSSLVAGAPHEFERLCKLHDYVLINSATWSDLVDQIYYREDLVLNTNHDSVLKTGYLGSIWNCDLYTDGFLPIHLQKKLDPTLMVFGDRKLWKI